jgi:predicted GNAT superfamily acetyltransferase
VPRPEIIERISVPADIAETRREDPKSARRVQQDISNHFDANFSRDLAVVGVEKSVEGGAYLFGRWE